MQGVKHTTGQILQIVSFIFPNISRKFSENTSMRFPTVMLTDRQTYKPTEMKT